MTKVKPLSKAQYETLAAFRYALRRFLHFSEQAAHDAGLTPQQHQALLAIKGFPARDRVTVGELAERLQLQHHSAVGLVDRLVSEKLVGRSPSAEDRRQVFVQLTPRGEKVLNRLSSAHTRQLNRLGPELNRLLQQLDDGSEMQPPKDTARSKPGQLE
ncbi:MAG TPA: MarR family transcriptional regulator [Verrucomicrobiae bacterium]|nr:MarR family transcriptional regulator [Verrucomicrobiae bacterium]